MDLPLNCIYHVLAWNYKDEITPERRAFHEAELLDLPNRLPMLLSVRKGPVIGGRNQSFSHCFLMIFADRQGLEEYATHMEHLNFAVPFREACEIQMVIDFEA